MASEAENDLLVKIGLTEKQYLQALARMEAATAKAANKNTAAFVKQNRKFTQSAQQANKAASTFSSHGLRMMSMQFSQVAQQGAATGDYMRALAIQLPDLALGFGTVGIAIGALAPVLLSVAQGYIGAGEAAQRFSESLEKMTKETLTAQEELQILLRGLNSVEELRALQGIAELERKIADVQEETLRLKGGNLRGAKLRLESLRKERDEAQANLDEYRNTVEALKQAKDLGQTIAGTDIGAGIRDAVVDAESLAGIMREVASITSAMANNRSAGLDQIAVDDLAAQYAQYGAGQQAMRQGEAAQRYSLDGRALPTAKVSPRSGGAVRDITKEYETLRASLDPVYAATKAYEDAQKILNDALRRGRIDQGEFNSTLSMAKERLDEATRSANDFGDTINSALEDLIVNGKSASEVLSGILRQLASSAITGKGTFGSLFGGQGLGSMILGGVTGGIPFFAEGTNSAPGGLAVVGEKGPELVNLPKGSQVIPNHSISRAMGGTQKVELVIIGDEGGTFAPRVADISTTQAVRVSSVSARQQQRNFGAAQAELDRRGTSR